MTTALEATPNFIEWFLENHPDSATFNAWGGNEPNGDGICGDNYYSSGNWNDLPCTKSMSYLCQKVRTCEKPTIELVNPPSFISALAGSTDTISAYPNDISHVGVWDIDVKISLRGLEKTSSFKLTVQDLCPLAVITPSTHDTEIYVLGDATKQLTFAPFTIVPNFCSLDYILAIPSAISNAVTADVSTLSFHVNTSDQSLIGTYPLTVTVGNAILTI